MPDRMRLYLFGGLIFRQSFGGKDVALVGNGAGLVGSNLGDQIDGHQVVVRFNVAETVGREADVGSRTDIRFVGLTLKGNWCDQFEAVSCSGVLWTLRKNCAYLERLGRKHLAFPSVMPLSAIKLLRTTYGERGGLPQISRPPRTGTVFLLMLLRYGNAKSVTLYGFARDEGEALDAVYGPDNEVVTSDRDRYFRAHCDPEEDIKVVRYLEAKNVVRAV